MQQFAAPQPALGETLDLVLTANVDNCTCSFWV